MSNNGMKPGSFRKYLEFVINKTSKEAGSNTPDFILADYLAGCLENFDKATNAREEWYGRKPLEQADLKVTNGA